ncbi:hypothetical protein LOTGIDRAFT_228753 [Lottia gigantea]|uniref:Chloride channel protein n=1 Tax=Lottia gigantea TaxID=225164 RepID=V3ZIY5_LOTGI|nr:hypothetical protein LOTGIDRAFT_228753 [Lottia gigantea]ESO91263.1 hypothetical protein LOTGIDRAFT_228753 [Lottia gigantea]
MPICEQVCSCCAGNDDSTNERMSLLNSTSSVSSIHRRTTDIQDFPNKDYESLNYDRFCNKPYLEYQEKFEKENPVAGGSGIPEIKCYLNGICVPRIARFHTLVAKSVGVLFSVAGGLFVGKEGPMIHSGAIIGSGIPQLRSITCPKLKTKYNFFRCDRDKRDFVSGGAAAGVAAAFGAPIGGVLFSLEEGSSFWNQKLTWRTFFCSMAATFSLNFFLSGIKSCSWGYFYLPGLIDFGTFRCQSEESEICDLWSAVDLLIFIIMGLVGGGLGAIFNTLNKSLSRHRLLHVQRKHKIFRLLEAMLVAMVTTTLTFLAAMTLGECRKLPEEPVVLNSTKEVITNVRTYFCADGYYNDMATLFFNPQEVAIKQLFHQPARFGMPSLAIFFMLFFFLACWTYGVAVPSGLFVPSLLCGAAYGRFVALVLKSVFGYESVYSGTYALVGAAAFLGGVANSCTTRLESLKLNTTCINIVSYPKHEDSLPGKVAKWSGDLFNEGLYDIHIKLKSVPLLEWDVPPHTYRMKAMVIMSKDLKVVFLHTRVASLVQLLKTTAHNVFPVVTTACQLQESGILGEEFGTSPLTGERSFEMVTKNQPMKFEGLILRSHIVILLKKRIWFKEGISLPFDMAQLVKNKNKKALRNSKPSFPEMIKYNIKKMTGIWDDQALVHARRQQLDRSREKLLRFNLYYNVDEHPEELSYTKSYKRYLNAAKLH